MAILVGVDVGGTFTDILIFDTSSGSAKVVKTPSTPDDQSVGFLTGLQSSGVDIKEIRRIIHGTTVGTNAVLERKGARVGLITTKGFRDVLEMRRRERAQTWGLWGDYTPLVPRKWRHEVTERVLADGTERVPLNEAEVVAAAKALLEAGVESIAVCFLHSYANAAHELRTVQILKEIWPNRYVSRSSDILPEIREFERTSTTAVNAYVQPKMDHYLSLLQNRLADHGYAKDVSIIQSNGGIMSSQSARDKSVNTVLSGPAAGVIAAAQVGSVSGFPNIITADMGGTSFDVSLVLDGKPSMQAEQKIEFGVVVRTPMIEITTIGAGGGSIAWIDGAGFLQIGPESAGSFPGPAAFGRGGTRPTVTDANIVLGRIDADDPIGAKGGHLDVEAAKRAIESEVAIPLGLDVYAAAEAILTVATSKMAGALRLISVERGHDPRDFALVPFGGAGPLHAAALIRECGIGNAVVPYYPGITSAIGCVAADAQFDFLRTVNQRLDQFDVDEGRRILEQFRSDGVALVEQSDVDIVEIEVAYQADMAYEGQTHTVLVDLNATAFTIEGIQSAFSRVYEREFSQTLANIPIRLQTLRATVKGVRPRLNLRSLVQTDGHRAPNVEPEPCKTRQVYFDGAFRDTPIYARRSLRLGDTISGPAIIEQSDTTTVVEPNMTCSVDEIGHLIIRTAGAESGGVLDGRRFSLAGESSVH